MGEILMNRKQFMQELHDLLLDISEEERNEALSFYENYFDEAGQENEQHVIEELGDPRQVANMIKNGLTESFDEHIQSGNGGFSSRDYQNQYEVIDTHKKEKQQSKWSKKWHDLEARDQLLLVLLAILALFPVASLIGDVFGVGFSIAALFFCIIFGFWILSFVLYVLAIVLIVLGAINLLTFIGTGCIYMGIGCVALAMAQLFHKIAKWFFKECIPQVIDSLSQWVKNLLAKRGVQS